METSWGLFYGLAFTGFLLFVLIIEQYKRFASLQRNRAHHLDDILSTAPEGFYYEIQSENKTQTICSRKLCLMLNIIETNSDFNTVSEALSEKSRQELSVAWQQLKKTENSFELAVQNPLNLMHFMVRGHTVQTNNKKFKAYILWFENISQQTAEFTQSALKYNHLHNEKDILTETLNTLPFPVGVFKTDHSEFFTNTAYQQSEDSGDLHWEHLSFHSKTDSFKVSFGQDKTAEERLSIGLSEANRIHLSTLKTLPVAVCIFDATTRLSFYNKAFAELWKLESGWLKKQPLYDDFLNKIQEMGYLPQVKDFAQYKTIQKDLFSKLAKPQEDYIYLENGRIVHRTMVPHTTGSILFIDELKGFQSK